MADITVNSTDKSTSENANIVYVWRVPVDKGYILTFNSFLQLGASIISLIAFICVVAGRTEICDITYASTYNYFEFVTTSTFFTVLFSWLIYTLTLRDRLLFRRIPWLLVDLCYCGIFIVFYFIANIVLACQTCGADSNKAGCAFGFFAMFCLLGYGALTLRDFRSSRQQASGSAAQSPGGTTAQGVEQY